MTTQMGAPFSAWLIGLLLLLGNPSSVGANGDHQEFPLGDVLLESGATLPNARVVYVT